MIAPARATGAGGAIAGEACVLYTCITPRECNGSYPPSVAAAPVAVLLLKVQLKISRRVSVALIAPAHERQCCP